jgi:hypothetical protein
VGLAAPATVVVRSTADGGDHAKALGGAAAALLVLDLAGISLWLLRPAGR